MPARFDSRPSVDPTPATTAFAGSSATATVLSADPSRAGGAATAYSTPGRLLPPERRIELRDQVVARIRKFLQGEGYAEAPSPGPAAAVSAHGITSALLSLDSSGVRVSGGHARRFYLEEIVAAGADAVYYLAESEQVEAAKRETSLGELCDFQEKMVKDAAAMLTADEIGGPNLTRLDRMTRAEHPRMTYREALAVLRGRGFGLDFGDELAMDAEAVLTYYCGNLPVHITHFPKSLKPFNGKTDRADPTVVECVAYVFPFAGETFGGSLWEPDIEILRRRLYSGTLYAHLMDRAREREACSSPDELAGCCQRGVRAAFEDYLSLFAGARTERGGVSLAVGRLLRYFMGVDYAARAKRSMASLRVFG